MEIALYQPEIPQNTGTLMRLCACFDITLNIIFPCGFVLNDRNLRRAGMDYIEQSVIKKHLSWDYFISASNHKRVVLATPYASTAYTDFTFQQDDILLFGSESSGVPEEIHEHLDHHIKIPMKSGSRSLNLAVSAGIIVGEALRQTKLFPRLTSA
ncbi:MAG: tRNA (cytidine(34)-2'-O)-methyltransferase [Alphaproteobacteria bacterium]|nr:tRNA (cytidine(34)-2'-O)-methyltransferase [Alphaproteobacteria bacterium]